MKSNPQLKALFLEVVENQLKDNDPPETKQTYNRLIQEGFSKKEVKDLLGCAVSAELFDVMKNNKPFNVDKFVKALHKLPEFP